MRIDIITLFPAMFTGPLSESIVKRAIEAGAITTILHQLRDYSTDKHHTVDDSPYGGGAGMVLRVDVVAAALKSVIAEGLADMTPYIVLLTPQGQVFNQALAKDLSQKPWLIFICGHYEGFDERIRSFVDAEISIGDYVLTGGELAAMVITDAVTRLIPGVLGKEASTHEESHENNLLEYPHYTRPDDFNGQLVPEVLKSGNHAAIADWRAKQSVLRTKERRPDLLS